MSLLLIIGVGLLTVLGSQAQGLELPEEGRDRRRRVARSQMYYPRGPSGSIPVPPDWPAELAREPSEPLSPAPWVPTKDQYPQSVDPSGESGWFKNPPEEDTPEGDRIFEEYQEKYRNQFYHGNQDETIKDWDVPSEYAVAPTDSDSSEKKPWGFNCGSEQREYVVPPGERPAGGS